jgi:myo-inositol catabolism protein IolC
MVEHFEHHLRGSLTSDLLPRLSEKGVHPAAWKLEAPATEDVAAQVAAGCDKGQAILLVDKFSRSSSLASTSAIARTSPRFAGFAAGRSVYWPAFHAHLQGAPPGEVVGAVREAFLESVASWERAAC